MRPASPQSVECRPEPASAAGREELVELRGRVEAGGPEALTSEEALQLFLGRVAGAAAGELARRLLARFGSLPEVLGAPLPELLQVASAGVARELQLLHDLHGRALREPFRVRPLLSCASTVTAYLRVAMSALPREQFRVLFLDKKNQLIADEVMAEGTVDHAPVYPREVMRRALELSASAVILAHNHPSRDATPSGADIDMTRGVVDAGRALRIAVHEHYIVAGGRVLGLRAEGLL